MVDRHKVVAIVRFAIVLCLSVKTNAVYTQRRLSHELKVPSGPTSVFQPFGRHLYAWFTFDPADYQYRIRLIFRYGDHLRIPTEKDSIRIIFFNGDTFTFGNETLNTIRAEHALQPGFFFFPKIRTVVFEITYEAVLSDAVVRMLGSVKIQRIQLISAPPDKPLLWSKDFGMSWPRNFKRAMKGHKETVTYGKKKLAPKMAKRASRFFRKWPAEEEE